MNLDEQHHNSPSGLDTDNGSPASVRPGPTLNRPEVVQEIEASKVKVEASKVKADALRTAIKLGLDGSNLEVLTEEGMAALQPGDVVFQNLWYNENKTPAHYVIVANDKPHNKDTGNLEYSCGLDGGEKYAYTSTSIARANFYKCTEGGEKAAFVIRGAMDISSGRFNLSAKGSDIPWKN